MNKETKHNTIFVQGPVTPERVAQMIANHESKKHIGAHDVFMGQVRADEKDGQRVSCIEYTAYEDMANEVYKAIKEDLFAKYELSCMHVAHSLGRVDAGLLSLVAFVSSPHRAACMQACTELVERLKKELPVWGKEIMENETVQWKVNT